jgi:ferredoxin
MALKILRDLCLACGECESACPTDSIAPAKGVFQINADTCTECEGHASTPQCQDACLEDGCIVPA